MLLAPVKRGSDSTWQRKRLTNTKLIFLTLAKAESLRTLEPSMGSAAIRPSLFEQRMLICQKAIEVAFDRQNQKNKTCFIVISMTKKTKLPKLKPLGTGMDKIFTEKAKYSHTAIKTKGSTFVPSQTGPKRTPIRAGKKQKGRSY